MNSAKVALGLTAMLVMPGILPAAELKLETLRAWDAYLALADARVKARLDGGRPFLWADEAPGRSRQLRQGEILVTPVGGRGSQSVPGGLIHDWMGSSFAPEAKLTGVLAVIHDYGRYKDIYTPVVADSKTIECGRTEQKFSMLWERRVLFVTAALNGVYEARDFPVGTSRWYSVATTTEVREVADYGERGERLLPPDHGSGYIWRLRNTVRLEERDGGVYVELEALVLTRDIPASLHWLVSPVIARLARNSVIDTLSQTRQAVGLESAGAEPAACGYPRWSVYGSGLEE
ncbi:MAG: hypothetical protein ACLPX8_03390 [Bryobacteraceae bacterium]|jgi:hypothetical protein